MYKYIYYIKCQPHHYNSLPALTRQVQISIFQILEVIVGKTEIPFHSSKPLTFSVIYATCVTF